MDNSITISGKFNYNPVIGYSFVEYTTGDNKRYLEHMKRYIINDKAVIIFWNNGEKTIAKCDGEDKFDKELGFMIAFYRYMMTYVNKYKYSKTEIKKLFECINNEKLKDYLFIWFNKITFQNTEKTRKFLSELKVGVK